MKPNPQQTTGEHLLLIRGTHWSSGLSPAELQRIMTEFYGWVEALQEKGLLRGAQPLMEEGKLVTGAHGLTTDGAFAESKEAIAGYFLLALASTAEAVRVARACPILAYGAQIEVRPVADLCRPMADVKAAMPRSGDEPEGPPPGLPPEGQPPVAPGTVVSAGHTHTLHLHRVLRAKPELVYKAFLDADALSRWLPPNGFVGRVSHLDPRVGGTFKMTFTQFNNGHSQSFGGEYLELVPNQRIRHTDAFDDPTLPGLMEVTVTLDPVSCGTELHLTQAGVPAVIPKEACHLGWQESLAQLAKLVEGGPPSEDCPP